MTEAVHTTKVTSDTKDLTVSTVKVGHRRYETVIFDDHGDKRHAGKVIGGHVIDVHAIRSTTRDDAMEAHREALYAARTEEIA